MSRKFEVAPHAAVIAVHDLIRGWCDYVDVGVIEAQKAGRPRAAWLDALIDRPAL